MKIGVLSDTHIPHAASKLPGAVYKAFTNVDLILHAGDIVDASLLEELGKLAKTEAVRGNMDSPALQKSLPEKKIIKAGSHRIGLMHGSGVPYNMINKMKNEFSQEVDVIVFGHSHSPVNEKRDGILFFNPGSPTDKLFTKYNSYGILTVGEDVKGEIVKLK